MEDRARQTENRESGTRSSCQSMETYFPLHSSLPSRDERKYFFAPYKGPLSGLTVTPVCGGHEVHDLHVKGQRKCASVSLVPQTEPERMQPLFRFSQNG
ncbi:hypothetical protein KUCAC02_027796 [Chaenocephalus aceratus]|nr:hypothetical protein KUCAC02_027796 [Chaenocephalus aceratus]